MSVDLIVEDARWADVRLDALAERAAAETLRHLGLDLDHFEISLLACGDARIAALNAGFRGKSAPTNVLSWPSAERAVSRDGATPVPPDAAAPELGDIAIAYDTCAREAAAAGRPMADHVAHLVVHGVLHLLGYDHVRDGDASLMEAAEVAILGKMGLSDPYCL